jgi:hypothetical protein
LLPWPQSAFSAGREWVLSSKGWARQPAASSQLSAFPHVLELAKARALLFPQQGCQGLRLPGWHGFAPVQMAGNRPLQVHKVGGVVRFPAHDTPPNDLPESVCNPLSLLPPLMG